MKSYRGWHKKYMGMPTYFLEVLLNYIFIGFYNVYTRFIQDLFIGLFIVHNHQSILSNQVYIHTTGYTHTAPSKNQSSLTPARMLRETRLFVSSPLEVSGKPIHYIRGNCPLCSKDRSILHSTHIIPCYNTDAMGH